MFALSAYRVRTGTALSVLMILRNHADRSQMMDERSLLHLMSERRAAQVLLHFMSERRGLLRLVGDKLLRFVTKH